MRQDAKCQAGQGTFIVVVLSFLLRKMTFKKFKGLAVTNIVHKRLQSIGTLRS